MDGCVFRYADELQTLTRLLEPLTIFGAHTFPHNRWPALKPYEVSLVEQAICMRAMAFVASGLSAWSGNVVRRFRRIRLCPPSPEQARTRRYDGSRQPWNLYTCKGSGDTEKMCPPAIQLHLGREYGRRFSRH